MQTALVRIADVHPGAFPDRFQTLKFVDLSGVVLLKFVDVRELALAISFEGFFVVWIDRDGGSSWHRKKLAKAPQKTTNNLVPASDLFPLPVGGPGRPKPTILWSAVPTYSQPFLPS
jgi:hypothetical protein